MEEYILRLWRTPPNALLIETGQVHVWRVDLANLGQNLSRSEKLLSEDESIKAKKFYLNADRIKYICTRAAVREILGEYLGVEPDSLIFSYSHHGKPYLADLSIGKNFTFNISHAGNLSLLAVTKDRRIGVDLEPLRKEDAIEPIARRFFTPEEARRLLAMPEALRPEAFFTCWTRKEAFIKAQGEGLSIPLNQFKVTFTKDEIPRLILADDVPGGSDQWSIFHLEAGEGYVGALVVEGIDLDVVGWDWRGIPDRINS